VIAVDTNVVLRRLLGDDVAQSEKARRLFEAETEVLITDIVLAEAVWTIKGKRYSATREDIIALIMGLLGERNVVFESRQAVWSAVNDFAEAKPVKSDVEAADFADALIVNKAKITARRRDKRYRGTYTFDKAALAIDGTKAP
jgi:predicted nucleic-acid-binding protein